MRHKKADEHHRDKINGERSRDVGVVMSNEINSAAHQKHKVTR